MPKKDESFLDYKKRIMDPLSHSICAAKWYNATIWLGSGETASCHHPPAHKIDEAKVRENPKFLHNTGLKKQMRKQMLAGGRPQECESCWKIEDMDRKNVSDRIFKTIIYDDDEIAALKTLGHKTDIDLKTLEIAFDRTCNFACSYCGPDCSSTWANDIRQKGPYQGLRTEGKYQFNRTHDDRQNPHKKTNPYTEAFWKWWPELSQTLQELRITGGEPLLSPDFWKVLEFFGEFEKGRTQAQAQAQAPTKKMVLAVNTNLGAKDDLIEKLIEKSHNISHFELYTSCEATGAGAEYIRDGLHFETFIKNFEAILERGNFRRLHLMMTINALCLFSLPEFLDRLTPYKEKYGRDKPNWTLNILRYPAFQAPLVLPYSLREERKIALEGWLERNRHSPHFHEMELVSVQRLIDYLEVGKASPQIGGARVKLEKDFKAFFLQYDERRGKDFRRAFPAPVVAWYDSIPPLGL